MSVPVSTPGAAFLSYASQDAEAAKRICDALRAAGVEVWFDQSELRGGDAWDAKIRKQIKECALFVPVISANTQARHEGYFRLEWHLAEQRSHLIARGRPFIVPVSVDETRDNNALVPDAFLAVQWMRLPGGETPAAFCERLRLLLGGEGAPASSRPSGRDADKVPALPPKQFFPRWVRPILASAVVVVTVLAVTLRKKFDDPARANSVAAAAAEKLSPARQLAERARPLIFSGNRRADLETAQGLIEQAAKLDPNDASIWAEWAMVDSQYLDSWLDHSATRKASAQTHAARAMSLDPRSRDARFARAITLAPISDYDPAAKTEAAEILRPLVAENPQDGAALLALGYAEFSRPDHPDEALAAFKRAAQLPGLATEAAFGQLVANFYSGRYAEAEKVLDASLANDASKANDGSILSWKIYLALIWRGDLDEAARLEHQLPTSWRLESLGAVINWYVYAYRREPEKALAALRMVTSDELFTNLYSGPKGLLVGDLLEMGRHTDAAQVEWSVALKTIEQRFASAPNDQGLLEQKISLLERLGQRAEAERLWRLDLGLYGDDLTTGARLYLMLMMEPVDRSIDVIEKLVRGPFSGRVPTAARLRYDPMYDPLRKFPRFAELIALAEADPRLSPKAAGKFVEKPGSP